MLTIVNIFADMELQTKVELGKSGIGLSYPNRVAVLGSCFAEKSGIRLKENGFDVLVNPFGTLYNPASICQSIARLASGKPFTGNDVVMMGSGAGLYCSFSHHTLAARTSPERFLDDANRSQEEAAAFWKLSDRVILTLGTSWCYRHRESGLIVSNCLKRPGGEFERVFLSAEESAELLSETVAACPDKSFFLTVSPIRHLRDGARGNSLSKAALLTATEKVTEAFPGRAEYFPSYEIMMDELRDYRFYAEDMVHPSEQASQYIFERFIDWALPEDERGTFAARHREHLRTLHRPMLGDR